MESSGRDFACWPLLAVLFLIIFWLALGEKGGDYLYALLCTLAEAELGFPEALWRMTFCTAHWQKAQSLQVSDWSSLWTLLEYASAPWGRLTALVIFLLFCLSLRLSVRERFCQSHSMQSLLKRHVQSRPCLAPILNWGRSLLEEDVDSGPWMCARQPLQFAVENGLLFHADGSGVAKASELLTPHNLADPSSPWHGGKKLLLNQKLCHECFARQLGPRFMGFTSLPPYLLALTVAFALFGLDRKEQSLRILHRLSLSFRPASPARNLRFDRHAPFLHLPAKAKGFRICAKLPLQEREIQTLLARKEIVSVIRPHNRYTHLLLYALYAFARRRGVLSCAELIWLKPVNRPLFYLLNNYGRRTYWVEACGALAHYRVEEGLAAEEENFSGQDCDQPCVQEAVHGLELALYDEGWISLQEGEN